MSPPPMQITTVVARNYFGQARVLVESFLRWHPDGRVCVLVLDDPEGAMTHGDPRVDVVGPEVLALTTREFHTMAMIYDVTELATAVKPWLLHHSLRSCPVVTYLDPDIQVFGPLGTAEVWAETTPIVLTPHIVRPMTEDDREPPLSSLTRFGTYNLGFITVGPGAGPFLEWWQARLRRHCLDDLEAGLFVDQRWIDLAVHLFPTRSWIDEACNVAYWNLDTRAIRWTDDHYEVNGAPLKFFHFSGYDPRSPDRFTGRLPDPPRVTFEGREDLARLTAEYRHELRRCGFFELTELPYGFGVSSSGIALERHLRRGYRADLIAAEAQGTSLPDPFDPADRRAFDEWADRFERQTAARRLRALRGTVRSVARDVVVMAMPSLRGASRGRRRRRRNSNSAV